MNNPQADPPDDDLNALAGEFFLGLLDDEGAARAAALRQTEPRFDLALRAWEARLAPLAEELAPVSPGPAVWAEIAAAITPETPRDGLWNSLAFWRSFGLGAGALAAAALALAFLPRPAAPGMIASATLATARNGVFFAAAETSGGTLSLLISPGQANIPAGKSAELWLVLPGQKPAALGLLAPDHAVTLPLAPLTGAQIQAAALAISLEPPGGSPTGAVTGPVVAAEKFSSL